MAAASIIARDEFVRRLALLGEKAGDELPKGASKAVVKHAADMINEVGLEEMSEYAKLHFKTTKDAKTLAHG